MHRFALFCVVLHWYIIWNALFCVVLRWYASICIVYLVICVVLHCFALFCVVLRWFRAILWLNMRCFALFSSFALFCVVWKGSNMTISELANYARCYALLCVVMHWYALVAYIWNFRLNSKSRRYALFCVDMRRFALWAYIWKPRLASFNGLFLRCYALFCVVDCVDLTFFSTSGQYA